MSRLIQLVVRPWIPDGSVWDYWYDGRYRLTKAVRDNAQTAPTITATYEYTYDDGDNMLTKVHPFEDRFDDANYTGWTVAETWSAANGYMDNTSSSTASPRFYKTATDDDFDLRFSYLLEDDSDSSFYVAVNLRDASGDITELRLEPTQAQIREYISSSWSTLVSDAGADSVQNTWYDVRVLIDGSDVTVWWGEQGGSMDEILSSTNVGVTGISTYQWEVFNGAEFRFDNIQIITDDFDSTTTYAYNNANELTKITQPDTSVVDFEYDLWGRMTKKELGTTYEATYGYRYFHKLVGLDSDWPSESDVDYEYDSRGRRRGRTEGSSTTNYNWAGITVINEENSSGSLTRFFVGRSIAHVDGSDPATGAYVYYSHDALASTRGLRDQSKSGVAEAEYTPFGLTYSASGAAPHYGFAQLAWDPAAQMHYAPYRYYSPTSGRWIGRDPLGLIDGPNMYGYVLNNPSSLIDPLGLSFLQDLLDALCTLMDIFGGSYSPNKGKDASMVDTGFYWGMDPNAISTSDEDDPNYQVPTPEEIADDVLDKAKEDLIGDPTGPGTGGPGTTKGQDSLDKADSMDRRKREPGNYGGTMTDNRSKQKAKNELNQHTGHYDPDALDEDFEP